MRALLNMRENVGTLRVSELSKMEAFPVRNGRSDLHTVLDSSSLRFIFLLAEVVIVVGSCGIVIGGGPLRHRENQENAAVSAE